MNIKVSIIVPIYNVENYLDRCLNSLVSQTLKDIEIICVDDGSTDRSLEIVNKFAQNDNRIKIIKQKNLGLSIARNVGISNAKGEYIGFVDSDDWVDLDFFEELYRVAIGNDIDIAVGGIIRQNKYHKKFHLKIKEKVITSDINTKVLLCDIPDKSYVWNKIYKKQMIIESNVRFEPNIMYEDVIFTPQIIYCSKKLATVPNVYYHYWRRANSIVRQKSEKVNMDSLYAHKKANEFFVEHNINIEHSEQTYRFKIFNITLYKVRTKGHKKVHILFNIIKW